MILLSANKRYVRVVEDPNTECCEGCVFDRGFCNHPRAVREERPNPIGPDGTNCDGFIWLLDKIQPEPHKVNALAFKEKTYYDDTDDGQLEESD